MPQPKKAASEPPAATAPARPRFATEAEERAFREEADSADYVGWSAAERVRLPNLEAVDRDDLAPPPRGHARRAHGAREPA